MRKRTIQVSFVAMALVIVLASSANAEWSTADSFSMNVAELIELVDRALYLATSGMSGYDEQDTKVLAQSLVNVFEGPTGKHYDDASVTTVDVGVMSHPLMQLDSNWVTWLQSLSGAKAAFAVESLANAQMYLGIAHETALALLEHDGGWFGTEYSWLITYAALLAAKGDADDPLLLPGLARLAALDLVDESAGNIEPEATLKLQAGVQETVEGGFLLLEAGVYSDPVILTRDITIRGESSEETILEGTFWVPAIQIVADQPITVRLQDLTIRGVTGLTTASTIDSSARIVLELENVHFVSNETGILVGRPTSLIAFDCLFEENGTAVRVSPLADGGLSDVILNDCDFRKNATALSVRGGDAVTLRYCRILDGTDPTADIRAYDGAILNMVDCTLERVAGGGIRLGGSAFAALLNNVIVTPYSYGITVGPRTEDDQDCGSGFSSDDESLPAGEVTGHGNAIEFGYCPVTMRFLTEPAPTEISVLAGESIQEAIDAVAEEGTVFVGSDSYVEALMIGKSLSLMSSGETSAENAGTVEIGGMMGDKAVVRLASDFPIEVHLRGLTLRNGSTGVEAESAVILQMDEVAFLGLGTGLKVTNGASVHASHCSFADNTSAVRAYWGGVCRMSDCIIERCTTPETIPAVQAAISVSCSDLTLERTVIRDNQGSGILIGGGAESRLQMVDCDLSANEIGLEIVHGGCNPGDANWEGTPRSEYSYGTISGWNNKFSGYDSADNDSTMNGILYSLGYRSIDLSFLTEPKPDE